MSYITREKEVILRQALQTLQEKTPITSIGPGSVARALAEVMSVEVADLYSVLTFNSQMSALSTARGRSLELFGALYNVTRKQLSEVAAIDQSTGTFYFYLEQPHNYTVTIPAGTSVYTSQGDVIGQQFSYVTTENAVIAPGRTRVYVGIRPAFEDSVMTTGANTITEHDADTGAVNVYCTNPKPITPQAGFESDENLRNRIIKAVRSTTGGTLEALRFTGLAVPGVRDVVMRSTPYGLGSVEAIVVAEDPNAAGAVAAETGRALERVHPVGVRLFIKEPTYTTVDITATVFLREDNNVVVGGPSRRAENAAIRYLNRLIPGGTMVYNQLVQAMFDSSDVINDVAITELRVAGAEILRRNFTPQPDEQLVPGTIRAAAA